MRSKGKAELGLVVLGCATLGRAKTKRWRSVARYRSAPQCYATVLQRQSGAQ